MSGDPRFFSSGAWLLGLGPESLRPLAQRLESERDEIPEGRYRLRTFAAGIQILGERPGLTLPSPLLQALAAERAGELKLLWAAWVSHRGSEFFECQYEHWRGPACLRRLSTGPILGDSIGWVAAEGVGEPWESAAFARSPVRGQATHATGWPALYAVATGGSGPVPLGNGTPEAEAEIFGARPRLPLT